MAFDFIEGKDFPEQKFDSEFSFDDEVTQAAERAFGIKYLFAWQHLVISNILDSAQTADDENLMQNAAQESLEEDGVCRGKQIVLLPTGSGKSLCFLTPALLLEGATLVLYPLLALMADQKRRMEEGGLVCAVFKGGQSIEEQEENFNLIETKKAKVILANPEVLQNKKILNRLKGCKISHIAIDEAHCVSEWGESFRPAYLTLGKIIKDLDVKVVTAFTATASPPVLKRISEILFDGQAHIVQSSSDRQNIHYEVRHASAKKKAVLKACIQEKKPLIVFCSTRRRTEEMARILHSYFGNSKVKFYHAGMTKEEKNRTEKWFFDTTDGILTATCAYGMGMDKKNIYTVIHLDAPEHLENFIQEAGRAGRNGENVKSILIWGSKDNSKWKSQKEGSREKAIGDFANTNECRRDFLLKYLSGESAVCSGCDICNARKENRTIENSAMDEKIVFNFIKRHRRFYTKDELINVLLPDFNKRDIDFYKQNVWEASDLQEILSGLLGSKKIKTLSGFWEGRIDIGKGENRFLRFLNQKTIHFLQHSRLRLRHFQKELALVLEQIF
ncbi:RecQ family ATP-dependent DNA helicase [Treponema pectinovorum]|uniref:RecQ family ATP-dependent DNA helicase n=1 Tax=Treponema pectinovorum TaxID=164 RepID=UPI0011F23874|nr:RecQ family ATP-dependent DNA helicase [Treponema pectinovorum]